MLAGFALGISRWVLNSEATCGDKDVGSFYCMDFNHMVLIIFAVASAVTIVVSLLTVRPLETQLQGTCATAAATTGTAVGCSGLSALDPMHRRMLLDSGELLLAIMLVLCVGFGYSAEPTRGGQTTISGGVLCILCTGAVVVVAHLGMYGVLLWNRKQQGLDESCEEDRAHSGVQT
mmetsp:Transcript_112860/g.283864  ORF Transcript_112860/g.283864 Transcript_112860/m.283864 type:complete len:176 (+) Transcript_112860:3-530(+)